MRRTAGVSESAWTEEDVAVVLRRWNDDGASAGVIARELDRTRNSVCGLISRRRADFADRSELAPALRLNPRPAGRAPHRAKLQPQPAWSEAEIETAVRLWTEWRLIREIAEALGKSRDAVNRFINQNREKFPNRHRPRRDGAVMAARPIWPLPVGPLPKRAEEIVAPVPDHAVTFLEVGDRHCRWPLWGRDENPGADGLCCGAPISLGLRYCDFHRRESRASSEAAT